MNGTRGVARKKAGTIGAPRSSAVVNNLSEMRRRVLVTFIDAILRS
jgi:hypothetical protein